VLAARGIGVDVREDGVVEVWVHDDARLGEAREVLERFRADPKAFTADAAAGAARRAERSARDAAWQSRLRHARRSMHGADGRGWVTIGVIVAAVAVWILTRAGADLALARPLFLTLEPPGSGLPEVSGGQVWRLVTPIFVHFGFLHLFGNGSMWWSLAARVEWRRGGPWLAGFVVVAAALSNLAELGWQAWHDPSRLSLVGGLSGVLYGLFGFTWIKGRLDPLDELEIPDQTWWMMIGWLLLCMTGTVGPVANVAHVAGLAVGAAAAVVDVAWFRFRKRR
jgi:GlpG protein